MRQKKASKTPTRNIGSASPDKTVKVEMQSQVMNKFHSPKKTTSPVIKASTTPQSKQRIVESPNATSRDEETESTRVVKAVH